MQHEIIFQYCRKDLQFQGFHIAHGKSTNTNNTSTVLTTRNCLVIKSEERKYQRSFLHTEREGNTKGTN